MRLDWHGHDADVYMQRGRMRAVCAEEVMRGMACGDGGMYAGGRTLRSEVLQGGEMAQIVGAGRLECRRNYRGLAQ